MPSASTQFSKQRSEEQIFKKKLHATLKISSNRPSLLKSVTLWKACWNFVVDNPGTQTSFSETRGGTTETCCKYFQTRCWHSLNTLQVPLKTLQLPSILAACTLDCRHYSDSPQAPPKMPQGARKHATSTLQTRCECQNMLWVLSPGFGHTSACSCTPQNMLPVPLKRIAIPLIMLR